GERARCGAPAPARCVRSPAPPPRAAPRVALRERDGSRAARAPARTPLRSLPRRRRPAPTARSARRSPPPSPPGSVDPRDDPARHPPAVLVPERPVGLGAAPVVVVLARHEQRDVVERIEPRRELERMAEAEGERRRHQDLAEIVDVAREPPEAAGEHVLAASGDCARLEPPEGLRPGIALELELLE